ncbi:uncharacterized protein SAPINGB_P005699 [Magnusiomyces paraingens]|uniref:Sugar phosphate transporter domain-containing protein n=1 Tax=Magnusiomyces paraingens TaxID=2606893 RepID=A0A5E8C3C9_9ASCO|nr:uncharacterized protein SAPINGB_P005699 [Saprochaete ingens]VVT57445.1 unnamed protein product [Saprochaete ingens]
MNNSAHSDIEVVDSSGTRHRASTDHLASIAAASQDPSTALLPPSSPISTRSLSSSSSSASSLRVPSSPSGISSSTVFPSTGSPSLLQTVSRTRSSTSTSSFSIGRDYRISPFDNFDDDYEDDYAAAASNPRALQRRRLNIQWIRNALISCVFIILWYAFSLSISIYNKWMFSAEHLDFQFPILTTSGHQFMQFILSFIVVKIFGGPYRRLLAATSMPDTSSPNTTNTTTKNNNNKQDQPLNTRKKNDDEEEDIEEETFHLNDEEASLDDSNDKDLSNSFEEEKPMLSPRDRWLSWIKSYLRGIVPTATASGADIGMGNASLRIVSLSFYTMVKSSSLGFVLLFGILFKLEVPTCSIFGIIGVMSLGVVMMVAGETEFSIIGFFLVLGAAMFSGLRWSLTQLLLRQDPHLGRISTHNDPARTIMYLAPPMGIFLFLWGCITEGLPSFVHAPMWADRGVFAGIGIMMVPGAIAFLMTLSEFFLLNRTSVLTLSIAGIFKELLTLVAAALYFGDRLSTINIVGLVITLLSIIMYNIYKFRRYQTTGR